MKDGNRKLIFITLQIMNIIFSLNGVLVKYASINWEKEGLFSLKTCLLLALAVGILAVYAVAWQAILGYVSLSVAYLSKGLLIFWALLWSALFFNERITTVNVIGAVIIFFGTLLVNSYE